MTSLRTSLSELLPQEEGTGHEVLVVPVVLGCLDGLGKKAFHMRARN